MDTRIAITTDLTDLNKALIGIARAAAWNDRIYINVKGNGGNYRGEQTTKLWITKDTMEITLTQGRGTTSRVFDANLERALEAITQS